VIGGFSSPGAVHEFNKNRRLSRDVLFHHLDQSPHPQLADSSRSAAASEDDGFALIEGSLRKNSCVRCQQGD
jgi:hypothetical protein